jgi:hypothetical protein
MGFSSYPDCFKCRHFYVTWDPSFPRGCRAFGIKSGNVPALEVRRATGRDCPVFEEKQKRK